MATLKCTDAFYMTRVIWFSLVVFPFLVISAICLWGTAIYGSLDKMLAVMVENTGYDSVSSSFHQCMLSEAYSPAQTNSVEYKEKCAIAKTISVNEFRVELQKNLLFYYCASIVSGLLLFKVGEFFCKKLSMPFISKMPVFIIKAISVFWRYVLCTSFSILLMITVMFSYSSGGLAHGVVNFLTDSSYDSLSHSYLVCAEKRRDISESEKMIALREENFLCEEFESIGAEENYKRIIYSLFTLYQTMFIFISSLLVFCRIINRTSPSGDSR